MTDIDALFDDVDITHTKTKGFNILDMYMNFCYGFGAYFDKKPNTDLAKSLYQADFEITPGMFMSLTAVTSFIVTAFIFFVVLILIHKLPNGIAYTAMATIAVLCICLSAFPFTLYNKISNKNMNIDHEMPFAISYMSVLSSGGSTPLEIIRRVSIEDYGDISKAFTKVLYRIDVLGEDAISALSYLIQNTSSELLRTVCIDISNSMQSGGGLKTYLDLKSKELMTMRRDTQKQFVESLSIYGEGYLSGVVMSVVLVVLMIVISSALGIDLKVMTPRQMFDAFVYLVLPFINILFLVMVWVKYSGSTI